MDPASWARVDRYWTRELGLESSPGELPPVSCTAQARYRGVQLFRNRAGLVVASPPRLLDRIRGATAGRSPDEIFSTGWLATLFESDAARILGPAALHYADATSFRAAPGAIARALEQSDSQAYHAFVDAVAPDVEESGIPPEIVRTYGAFENGTLCGVASYEAWDSVIAQISVVTDPAHRRRGFARASVSALARDALQGGLVLQWRALRSNIASLSLARVLGFESYASTIFVRLREG